MNAVFVEAWWRSVSGQRTLNLSFISVILEESIHYFFFAQLSYHATLFYTLVLLGGERYFLFKNIKSINVLYIFLSFVSHLSLN